MGPGRLALAGCLVATVALTGCIFGGTSKSPDEALAWTCGDFRDASSSQYSDAIGVLAQAVAKQTGNPVGEGKKVTQQVEILCAGASKDKVVGDQAVQVVAAGGGEDPAPAAATTTTTTTTAPIETTETTTEQPETTTGQPETTTGGTDSGSGGSYCYEADAPDRLEPGCQGQYGPPPSG